MTHQLTPPEISIANPARVSDDANAQSSYSDAKWLELKSDANMDAKLMANGYTQKQCNQMTMNDKVYAVSLMP